MARFCSALFIGFFVSVLSGCQGLLFTYNGKTVLYEERIALPVAREISDHWRTLDLTVKYGVDRKPDQMDITGVVRIADAWRNNFRTLQEFGLNVLLLDAQGRVLVTKTLVTSYCQSTTRDLLSFESSLKLPPGTASMSFTYTGDVKRDRAFFGYVPIR